MNHHTNRVVRSDRRGRAAAVPGLAAALLAPSLGAATVSGRLTQCCGDPVHSGLIVMAYEWLQVGIPGPRGCIRGVAERIVSVGSTTTLGDGSFSLTYVPSERQPEDCSFEAGVYLEVITPDRPWLAEPGGGEARARSPTQPRSGSADTVFGDLDLGFGSACPELGVSFSLEGPSVVTGEPGETVSFDVFVLLDAECRGAQIINVNGWSTLVTADGGSIVGATRSGTAAARIDDDPPGLISCALERTAVEPQSPLPGDVTSGCPSQPTALSSLLLFDCSGTGFASIPLAGAARRILRTTLEAIVPPPGLETSCRVYFRDQCPFAADSRIYQNVWWAGFQSQSPRLLDLEVKLRAQTTGTPFRRGDTNASGTVDISDAVGTFNHLFLGAAAPSCMDAADSNADGILDISDGVNTLGYLFGGTSEIPAPGPRDCGAATAPAIGCELYGSCD